MEAIRFTIKTKKLELVKLEKPKVTQPNEVLIKVAYSGVCGTDVHIIQGSFPCNEETFTLGHEFNGTVQEVGSEIKSIKVGDKVCVNPTDSCNCCHFCRSGNPHFCPTGGIRDIIGIFRNGGWAAYALVPVHQVHKLPDSISLEQAVLSEPLSCLAHGWDLICPVTVGQKILILGAGIIGNLLVCVLHLQGHRNVTVSEPNKKRLDLVKNLATGFKLITPDQLKTNQEADSEYLFDLIIDSSGYAPAIEHAVTLLQRGGKLCCFGVAGPNDEIRIKPFELFMRETKIFGVLTNPFSFPNALGLIESMGDRYLNFEKLGVKTFALNQYQEALDLLKTGNISKAVFKFN